jgi:uncharacterized protein YukE
MARLGMDVDQVESAGRALKDRAAAIDNVVVAIDKVVKTLPSVWEGPDAQKFVNEWWPEHRKQLVAAGTTVAGLGQSALNNASEQRDVSGKGGPESIIPGGGNHPTMPPTTPSQATPGGDFGSWRSRYPDGTSAAVDYDKNGIQCVDLVKQYVADRYGPGAVVAANGNEVWQNFGSTGRFEQIPAGTLPQAGDIVCIDGWPAHMGSKANDFGHTAIVDHVDSNGAIWMVQQSGSAPDKGIFVSQLTDFYKPYLQGYLRPAA